MSSDELVLNNINLIYHVLRKLNLYNQCDEFYDIAMIALVRASKRYDESLDYKASTYLIRAIENEIFQELKRRQTKSRKANYNCKYLEEQITDDCRLLDLLEDDINLEEEIMKKEQLSLIYKAISNLNEREQFIINSTFGINNHKKLNQNQIGQKLNVSHTVVSRVLSRAIKKIRKQCEEW